MCGEGQFFAALEYLGLFIMRGGHRDRRRVGYVYCVSEHIDFRMVARHVNNFVSCAECYGYYVMVMVIVIVGGRTLL